MSFQILILGPGDAVVLENVAPDVFDHAVDPALTADNSAAMAVYRGAGGIEEPRASTMFNFDLTAADKRNSLKTLRRP